MQSEILPASSPDAGRVAADSSEPASLQSGYGAALRRGLAEMHPTSLAIALLGAMAMAALTLNLWLPYDGIYMGTRLYDLYFAALAEGRFDLPLRELRLEGHYAPDGTGYLYHGLGPLVTRLLFAPFVDFPTGWITPLSIWLWAMAGNICCHRAFSLALAASPVDSDKTRDSARTLIAMVIWMSGPAWLLTSNGAIFSEPVAMAYALSSGIILLLARCAFAGADINKALIPLAILAGLTLHARPHLAVGYYAGVCIIAAFAAWRGAARMRLGVAAAIAILGLSGALLLASNIARFNAAGAMHGSFEGGEVQYGWVYLGGETADSDRAKGFSRYGQFNARRILPSALVYTLMPPPLGPVEQLTDAMGAGFHNWDPSTSLVRLEDPQIGTLMLWPVIMLLMALGLAQRALWRMPQAAGMFAVGAGSALLLSYGTITLRYHVDLWPLLMLPALFGVAPLVRFFAGPQDRLRIAARFALAGALFLGVSMSLLAAGGARQNFIEEPGVWTREFCLKLLADKHYSQARAEQICAVSYEP